VNVALAIVSGASPSFLIVTGWAVLVCWTSSWLNCRVRLIGASTVICGATPLPFTVNVASVMSSDTRFTVAMQLLSPVVAGVNVNVTGWSSSGWRGPTVTVALDVIWNCPQSPPVASATLTSTRTSELRVALPVPDFATTTEPMSSWAGVSVNAACATPPPPIQTPSNNRPSQRFDIEW
jgi:hypothetical protein